MSQPFNVVWEHDFLEALTLFDPKRFETLLSDLYNILYEEMNNIVIHAMYIAPYKTGNLQQNIHIIDADPQNMTVLAGTVGVYYAIYVNFGTTRHPKANPFWTTAFWFGFYRMMDRWQARIKEWSNT